MRIKFVQKVIDKIRRKEPQKEVDKFAHIDFVNNDINISEQNKSNISLFIEGIGNKVYIPELPVGPFSIFIYVYGNYNKIELGENFSLSGKLEIVIGNNHKNFGMVENCSFVVGENTSVESLKYITYNSNVFCDIEKDCLFSSNTTIFNTDAHPIYDLDTNKLINKVKGIRIGEHSWIGANVTILKNSNVPKNSIIGWGSVFSGSGGEAKNCAFAGNPARVVRRNIKWCRDGSLEYVKNVLDGEI